MTKKYGRTQAPLSRVSRGGKSYLFWGLYDLKSDARAAVKEVKRDFQGAIVLTRMYHGRKHYIVYAR